MKNVKIAATVNTNSRLYPDVSSMLHQKHLKSQKYNLFKNLVLESCSIPLPGLEHTTIENVSTNQMVPQGICCGGQYLLLTSYAHNQPKAYTSLIVLKSDGSYVKTIGLKRKIHAGGIAYHSQSRYVWISCDEPGEKTAQVMRVHLNTILNQPEGTALDASSYILFTMAEIPRSSYLTVHGDYLYIGYFSQTKNGKFFATSLNSSGQPLNTTGNKLQPLYRCSTQNYIQGVSFVKKFSKKYAIFSQSYGRQSDNILLKKGSKLLIYEFSELSNTDFTGKPDKKICMPVMIEQTYPYQDKMLFTVFESASHVYYDTPAPKGGNSKNQIDHICALDLEKMFSIIQ